jgi:hypothetical protein
MMAPSANGVICKCHDGEDRVGDTMGHVILLSELERSRPTRLRGPLPEGGATISLFLGVRYERSAMKHEAATVIADFAKSSAAGSSGVVSPYIPDGCDSG